MAFFLETSVQITRICGFKRNQEEINRVVQDKPLYTSNYVLMEFKRSLLKAFITFYSIMKEEEEVATAFDRFSMSFRPREVKHWFSITAWLIKEGCSIDEYSRSELLRKLETMIEWQLVHKFKKNVEFIQDEIVCDIYHVEPRDRANNYQDFVKTFTCRRRTAQCFLPAFVKGFDESLRKIIAYAEKATYIDEIKPTCQGIVQDKNKIRGMKHCARLADLIIYLECPSTYVLLTFDRDYEQLSDVLALRKVKRLTFHRA